jgi:hypothetical protein
MNHMVELVLFECLTDILRKSPLLPQQHSLITTGIKFDIPNENISFQEPAFHYVDLLFIQSLGYYYIEHPLAVDLISRGTFLFGCHVLKEVTHELFEAEIPRLAALSPLEVKNCPQMSVQSEPRLPF